MTKARMPVFFAISSLTISQEIEPTFFSEKVVEKANVKRAIDESGKCGIIVLHPLELEALN